MVRREGAEAVLRTIAERHLGGLDDVASLSDGRGVNHVLLATAGDQRVVVRVPIDPLRPDEFAVEEWCLAQAARHGIPSPRVLARGRVGDTPYLIHSFVEGRSGMAVPPASAWRTLGTLARDVASMRITGDAPDGLFSRFGRHRPAAWSAHLRYNLAQLGDADPLIALGVYAVEQQHELRSAVRRLAQREWSFGLRHGDLAPRNLVYPADGPAVLIDWGAASAGIVPYGDLLVLVKAHHRIGEPTPAQLRAFAAELDMSPDDGVIEDLLLLDALDLVRWALDQRPDRLADIVADSQSAVRRALG